MPEAKLYSHPCRLYIVSPSTIEINNFTNILNEILKIGDVGAFQLRLKNASNDDILCAAQELLPICRANNVAFIMNDSAEIAAKVGADGLHLGQDDMSVTEARSIVGDNCVIGVSCHDSPHMAMTAGEQGANYVAFGAFYPTTSKSPEKLAKYGTPSPEILEWWYKYTVIPCVAIGGITPENCAPLVESGADFIAAINSIWTHKRGPVEAVKDFNVNIKKALKNKV